LKKKLDIEETLKNKPGNESKEHYLCKLAGLFYLYSVGCKILDTEVYGFMSDKDYQRYNNRSTIKIEGIREEKLNNGKCPYCGNDIEKDKYSYKHGYSCVANNMPRKNKMKYYSDKQIKRIVNKYKSLDINDEYCNGHFWKKDGDWYRKRKSNSVKKRIDCAGIDKASYANIENAKIRGIEAKASCSDFKSGYCTKADITYIITPKGTIPKEDMEKYIGLMEVDIDNLEIITEPKVHVVGLDIVKRATTNKSKGLKDIKDRQLFVKSFIEKVARKRTIETVYGNRFSFKEV